MDKKIRPEIKRAWTRVQSDNRRSRIFSIGRKCFHLRDGESEIERGDVCARLSIIRDDGYDNRKIYVTMPDVKVDNMKMIHLQEMIDRLLIKITLNS